MNITFLIGNGFDLNLGLKTRYTDFYPYYLKNSSERNGIIHKEIAHNYSNWADLEEALGKLLWNVERKKIETFLRSKIDLDNCLAEYLRFEQKRIKVNTEAVRAEFLKNIPKFYEDFSNREKIDFLNWKNDNEHSICYQFISFNYTEVLDSIVRCANTNKQNEAWSIGNVLHLHGTVTKDLVLGLNDVSQICNASLRNLDSLTRYIIKEMLNSALDGGKTEAAKEIIDKSGYVCVYGMSLGNTDSMWWKYLANWLHHNNQRRLVLFVYEKDSDTPTAIGRITAQEKWKRRFLERAETKPEIKKELRSQIIVVTNSKIFDFSSVKLDSRSRNRG